MPVTRQGEDVIRSAARWPRDDNLKSFPTEGPHLVFDTDRPESAGGDVLESFRSSMTLDFLRQRFALTRIHPPLLLRFLLPSSPPPSFFSIQECPSPLLSQPRHVYVGVTGEEDEYRGWQGVGEETVGQALSEIPSYGWRTGRRWDFRYHARVALIIDKLLR